MFVEKRPTPACFSERPLLQAVVISGLSLYSGLVVDVIQCDLYESTHMKQLLNIVESTSQERQVGQGRNRRSGQSTRCPPTLLLTYMIFMLRANDTLCMFSIA